MSKTLYLKIFLWYNKRVIRVATERKKEVITMFQNVSNAKIRMNGDKMHQVDRNKLRVEIMAEIMQALQNAGVECGVVREGVAVNVAHDELGCVNFVVDIKMKNADFDFDFEVEDYQAEQKAKAEKAQAQAEAKARKIQADKERRAKAQAQKEEK